MTTNTVMMKTVTTEKFDSSLMVTTGLIEFTAANLSNTEIARDEPGGLKTSPPIEFDDAISLTEYDKHVAKFRRQSAFP